MVTKETSDSGYYSRSSRTAVARIQGILLEINIVENKSELYCQNQSFGTGLGSISHY